MGRDRLRPPPTPKKGPTGDSPSSARGADRQNRKFSTLRTKLFRSSEGRQTWQKRPGPQSDPKSEDGATKSPSVPALGEVENLGAPSPTRKPTVGSTSDRCQTNGPDHGSKLPKFEADRTDGFRDTEVRKYTPSRDRPISTTAIGRYPGNRDAGTTSRLRISETVGDTRSACIEHLKQTGVGLSNGDVGSAP
jgi:hypothetical protein